MSNTGETVCNRRTDSSQDKGEGRTPQFAKIARREEKEVSEQRRTIGKERTSGRKVDKRVYLPKEFMSCRKRANVTNMPRTKTANDYDKLRGSSSRCVYFKAWRSGQQRSPEQKKKMTTKK